MCIKKESFKTFFYNGLTCGGGSIDLPSLTQGTATASDISSGKTAWVNGEKIVGELINKNYVINLMM